MTQEPPTARDRFDGIVRLFGTAGAARIAQAHVGIIGLGGVGSWAVEALARSGVGHLTLIDLDDVCVSNVNRQLHALESTLGQPKAEVLAQRIREIHPNGLVTPCEAFFTETTGPSLFQVRYDCVIDAIDDVTNKCHLIRLCHAQAIPLIVCGAAGGRRDPCQVRVADLSQTGHDRLLQRVRQILRRDYGFPKGPAPFGIEAVYSIEPPLYPQLDGGVCQVRPDERGRDDHDRPRRLSCDWGLGSAAFATGAFGFAAAARAIQRLLATP